MQPNSTASFSQSRINKENGRSSAMPLIVEFSGPPGSGKSTNCKHFSYVLSKENLRVSEFRDVKRYLNSLSTYHKWFLILKTVTSEFPRLRAFLLLLIRNKLFSFSSLYRYTKLVIFNGALQEFLKRRTTDVVLLDQWALQGLWSALVFKSKSFGDDASLQNFLFPTHWLLYFDVDPGTAAGRIAARGTSTSRFDHLTTRQCVDALECYGASLRRLYELSDCANKYSFSTYESPASNAQHFLQLLKTTVTV